MPTSCIYPPRHGSCKDCGGYSPRRTPYYTSKCTRCCKLDKRRRPVTGPKCGVIKVQGRGRVPVYRGTQGGVFYLTQTNDKIYIDSKYNIHKKPRACGPGAKRKSPKCKCPKCKCKTFPPVTPSDFFDPPSEEGETEWTYEELKKTGRPCSAHGSQHLCQIAQDTRKEHIRTTPDGKTQYHPRTCRWMHEALPSNERCQDLPEQYVESATLMQIPGEKKIVVEPMLPQEDSEEKDVGESYKRDKDCLNISDERECDLHPMCVYTKRKFRKSSCGARLGVRQGEVYQGPMFKRLEEEDVKKKFRKKVRQDAVYQGPNRGLFARDVQTDLVKKWRNV